MLTIEQINQNPEAIKHLTGLPADTFHDLAQKVELQFPEYREELLKSKERQRAFGAGQKPTLSIRMRLFAQLVYIRLHIPQRSVAVLLVGVSQSRISRDIRILVPLLHQLVPIPELWEPQLEDTTSKQRLEKAQHIIDGMEQPVYRSQDNETQKRHYSGKKKQHTLKSQVVTDTEHEIEAISTAFPGSVHDKAMSDQLDMEGHLEDGNVLVGDKAYQGTGKEEHPMMIKWDDGSEEELMIPRVSALIPKKKPRKGELTEQEKRVNRLISRIRIRVEHWGLFMVSATREHLRR